MDFSLGVVVDNFRQEVRMFLSENPPESFAIEAEDEAYGFGPWSSEFYQKMGQKGWISRSWPVEYGGDGRSLMEFLVMIEEFAYAGAPAFAMVMANSMARSIMERGNAFLKREFLPLIKYGQAKFWLALSEPDAGSDLLSMKTRAIKDSDYYIINGEKTWSSRAHLADFGFLICRTNPDVPPHKGLSTFILDKTLPGVTITGLNSLLGTRHHNTVTLDNVRVHKDYLLGEENKGFYHLLEGLEFDRFWGRFIKAPYCKAVTERIAEYINDNRVHVDRALEYKLAEIRVEIEASRLIFYRAAWMMQKNRALTYEGTLGKSMADEMGQRLFSLGLEIVGLQPRPNENPRWQKLRSELVNACLFSIGHTLAGGTSEIIRNTIATRGLGLPRE